jgi:hypothetical protein
MADGVKRANPAPRHIVCVSGFIPTDYAVDDRARVRFRMRWPVVNDWGFAAEPKALIMADWPDITIGSNLWMRELRRRREGQQPLPYSRPQGASSSVLPEPEECLTPYLRRDIWS